MGTGYKRFYLTSGSILLIFALIAPFIQYYYNYDNETYCGEHCWVEFCLKNGNKNLYFYNKEGLQLTFEPEGKVSDVQFYKKDGRYKSGYRLIDFITPYSKGVKYVFKIDAYKTACYAMNVTKDQYANVKWNFMGLDPYLIGNNLTEIVKCKDVTYVTTKNVMGICYTYWNETVMTKCLDVKDNSTCKPVTTLMNSSYSCVIGTKDVQTIVNECETLGWSYGTEFYDVKDWCCSGCLCGFKKDYHCNYVMNQTKRPNWSFKDVCTDYYKIDDNNLKTLAIKEVAISVVPTIEAVK